VSNARLLVLLHAAGSIVLIGACTHHAIVAWRGSARLCRVYAAVTAIAYTTTFALGLLAYPTYRVEVRGYVLDRDAPWASNLFDTKETFAALGLPLVIGALLLSRVELKARLTYASLVWLTAAIVWFDVISGLIVTMEKGV
jgi:hypothetical protein